MNTTKQILDNYKKYGTISDADIKVLKDAGIVNGIGGAGTKLFDILILISNLPYFDSSKLTKLVEDIDKGIAIKHDIEYAIGTNYIDFTIANIKFALGLYQLLGWTSLIKRIGATVITFGILTKYGKQYFNFKG